MTTKQHTQPTGKGMPTNDKADGANVGKAGEVGRDEHPDFQRAPRAWQAVKVIEGDSNAVAYLARLQAQQADPDELAVIVSVLYGGALRGFCRAIEKALGVSHA